LKNSLFTAHLQTSLTKTKDEIETYTTEKVDQQKHKASEVSNWYIHVVDSSNCA